MESCALFSRFLEDFFKPVYLHKAEEMKITAIKFVNEEEV
jgi:hypothetical protein